MITHDKCIFLRHKKNKAIGIFYGSFEDFTDNDFAEYDLTPIPFEKLDVPTLQELLGMILEDHNFHARCQYEPKILVDCAKHAGCTETMCADFLQQYIISLEKQYA